MIRTMTRFPAATSRCDEFHGELSTAGLDAVSGGSPAAQPVKAAPQQEYIKFTLQTVYVSSYN